MQGRQNDCSIEKFIVFVGCKFSCVDCQLRKLLVWRTTTPTTLEDLVKHWVDTCKSITFQTFELPRVLLNNNYCSLKFVRFIYSIPVLFQRSYELLNILLLQLFCLFSYHIKYFKEPLPLKIFTSPRSHVYKERKVD